MPTVAVCVGLGHLVGASVGIWTGLLVLIDVRAQLDSIVKLKYHLQQQHVRQTSIALAMVHSTAIPYAPQANMNNLRVQQPPIECVPIA